MFFANFLLALTAIITVLLSLIVFVSNPKKRLNQALFIFLASLFVWLITNLLTNISTTEITALWFARSTLVGAALIPYSYWLFCRLFVGDPPSKREALIWALIPVILLLGTPTSANISSASPGGTDIVTGPLYILVLFEVFVYIIAAFVELIKKYRFSSTTQQQKLQLKYMFFGGILTLIPGAVMNAILPVFGYDSAAFYGASSVIFLASFTTFAIFRHRLLDIRLIVARSIAYVLLLGTLSLAYTVLVLGISNQITSSGNEGLRAVIPFFAALLIAISFTPLKRFFDRITNKYFYRDAYDPQSLLDDLNNLLVSTIEINTLTTESAAIISKYLKSDFVYFAIASKNARELKVYGGQKKSMSNEEFNTIRHLSSKYSKDSGRFVPDELEGMEEHDMVKSSDLGLAFVAKNPLTDNSLLLFCVGQKKSGNPYSSKDIKMLDIIANELVIAVQNARRFEEIQTFAKTLEEKVEIATRDLRKANEKLKQLDQTKDDFISMASHQLRTPLTSVKGYVSMVLEGDVGKVTKKQQELLNQAFISSQRMVYLIADLLNVSRLKTGKFIIEAKETNLADVIEGEISQLTETAKARELEVTYKKPKNFPVLMLDETKIRQVIMNFADNAIYYTPSGGHININLEEKEDSIEFTVVDDGIGVPKTEQHHLFNKFYRAGNAKKARPDGTGLGLFMAKKVVVAQGGAIIFRSTEGKGSTFGFTFAKKPLLPDNYKGSIAQESIVEKPKVISRAASEPAKKPEKALKTKPNKPEKKKSKK